MTGVCSWEKTLNEWKRDCLYKLNKASLDCRVMAVVFRLILQRNQKSLSLVAQKIKHLVIKSVGNQVKFPDSDSNYTGVCWPACQLTWWTAFWAHALPAVKGCLWSNAWWEVVMSVKALNNVQLATVQWSLPQLIKYGTCERVRTAKCS